jgi:hypothetical protein
MGVIRALAWSFRKLRFLSPWVCLDYWATRYTILWLMTPDFPITESGRGQNLVFPITFTSAAREGDFGFEVN